MEKEIKLVSLFGEEAKNSSIGKYAEEQLKKNSENFYDKEDDTLIRVTARDFYRNSYLLLNESDETTINQIIKQFKKEKENRTVFSANQQKKITDPSDDINQTLENVREKVSSLIKNATKCNDDEARKSFGFHFLMNYMNQDGFTALAEHSVMENVVNKGFCMSTQYINILSPNSSKKNIDIIFIMKVVAGSDSKKNNVEMKDTPLYLEVRATIEPKSNDPKTSYTINTIDLYHGNKKITKEEVAKVYNVIAQAIDPDYMPAPGKLTQLFQTIAPTTLMEVIRGRLKQNKDQKVCQTKKVNENTLISINDGSTIYSMIRNSRPQKTLTDIEERYLEPLRPMLASLTDLKNQYQNETTKNTNDCTLNHKSTVLNQLCSALAKEIINDLDNEAPLTKARRKPLCNQLSIHINNALKKPAIKADCLVSRILRGARSLLAILSLALLMKKNVVHSLFHNPVESELHKVSHDLKQLSNKSTKGPGKP